MSVTVTNGPPPPPPGLVAAYGFSEGSGTTTADQSGLGNVGAISGAAWTAAGRFGNALSFDGTNDWVTVPDAASLDVTAGMTLEAWVRPTALGSWRTVLLKEQPSYYAYALYGDTGTNVPSGNAFIGGDVDVRAPAALALNTWTHLAATYDGTALRVYVNGTSVAQELITGPIATSTGPLRIGGNNVWPEWFQGQIDEVRVYNRALTAAELQADMNRAVSNPDTSAPSAPGTLGVSGGLGTASLTWGAATDDTGIARYNVHRSTTSGFTPGVGNRVAQPSGTSYVDSPLAAGTYFYRVTAEDAAGNVGPASNQASAVVTGDTTPPSVSITAPAAGATVSGTVSVNANASDNGAVGGVQFRVDGANLGAEDTAAPYSASWNTTTATNGSHSLTAVARDGAGNLTTSIAVSVTVSNAAPTGLVAAYGFEEGSGTSVGDQSGSGNGGTISGATWTTSGRYGQALTFDGVNDLVTVPDAASLDLTTGMTLEAWVNPTALTGWRTAVLKEQPANLVYGLYANRSSNRPNAQVFVSGADRNVDGTTLLPLNTWSHLAATYDGTTIRLYVNGAQVGQQAQTGPIATSTGALRVGGTTIWSEWFAGRIDEVRVYNRALTVAQVQADMNAPITNPDVVAPSAPGAVSASGGLSSVSLSWGAASDAVGVVRYNVHRSTTSGFAPSVANRVAQPSGTSYVDSPLAAGTYFYRVTAEDAAGNVGPAAAEASAVVTGDVSAPTAPGAVSASGGVSSVSLSWGAASDNVAVTRYNVHRSTTSGFTPGVGNRVAQPSGTSYVDSPLAAGTYFYRVTAEDAARECGAGVQPGECGGDRGYDATVGVDHRSGCGRHRLGLRGSERQRL